MKKNENTAGELRLVNRLSGNVHGGLSRIRLSLTFRIAAHYCLQMIRSLVPVCLLATVLFGIAVGVTLSGELAGMTAAEPVVTEAHTPFWVTLTARTEPEDRAFPAQAGRVAESLLKDGEISFLLSAQDGTVYRVRAGAGTIPGFWGLTMLCVVLADLFRQAYFFAHNTRLNRRVLKPIREIAELAATLSESNLSNRINLAGTKNELKDLASVINDMLDRIELAYNSQKQFVSDASHELRTPIAVIRGYTDMLKRWGKDDPEVLSEAITAISQETESMKDLVERLLFLARHDKKTLMMEKTVFRPAELLSEVCRESALVTPETAFVFEPPASDPEMYADRGMIKQVLRILCDNAVKYSPAGSTVTLSFSADGGCCSMSVRDQGPGIPAEDIARIFERFYRGDKARRSGSGGHGLGLSIARIIVVAHGGKIRVRSREGEGTTFTVELPLKAEEEQK